MLQTDYFMLVWIKSICYDFKMSENWRDDPRFKNLISKKEETKIRAAEKKSNKNVIYYIIAIIVLAKLIQRDVINLNWLGL